MLTEHQLLIFWSQVLALLLAARGLGALALRLGQPRVIGELAAGLLLGPSVLGALAPGAFAWLFPPDPVQKGLLAALAWVGVLLLLFVAGFETDLSLVRRLGRATTRVTAGSLLVPAACGLAVGIAMPDSFVGGGTHRAVFALFMMTALTVSALPVIAMVLMQLDLMRRSVSQVMVAAAMVNDVVGWLLLGLAGSLARSGRLELAPLLRTLLGLAALLAIAFTVGQRAVDALLRRARRRSSAATDRLASTLLLAIGSAIAMQAVGLEAVLGGFVAGVVLGRSRFQDGEAPLLLERVALAFLAPIFFAAAGLRADLAALADPLVAGWAGAIIAIASASKFAGSSLGGWSAGLPVRECLALGAGLNARGAVEIVVATLGLSLGVLNASSYTVIVLVALVTSMFAPPLLRAALHGWQGSDEEQERLERERLLGENVLVRAAPLLLPSHGGPNSVLAARILDLAWPEEVEVTILSAGSDVPEQDLAQVRSVFTRRRVVHEHVPHRAPVDAILEHARLGYGAIAVGATDERVTGRLVSPVIDDLLAASPLPVVMVRRGPARDAVPTGYRRLLVPAIGTRPGRAAQEIAYSVAARTGAQVLIAHVVTHAPSRRRVGFPFWDRDLSPSPSASEAAERVVEEARAFAGQMDVRAEAVIRTGVSASEELLALIRERGVDLLVTAANLRQLSGRPFLGHGVERMLEKAEATLVIVTAAPGWAR